MPAPTSSNASAGSLKAVTPHASNNLPDGVARSLWVGGAGNVEVIAEDDSAAVVIAGVAAGTLLPIRAKAVRAASTTATSIVALY
jgi:hypothetical protein